MYKDYVLTYLSTDGLSSGIRIEWLIDWLIDWFIDWLINKYNTFFCFKNQSFWEFDDVRMSVVRAEATPVGEHWFHCPRDLHDPLVGSAHKHIPSVIHVFAFSILAIIKWF